MTVGDLNDLPCTAANAAKGALGTGRSGSASCGCSRYAAGAYGSAAAVKHFSIVEVEGAELGSADARRILQHSLEHRLQLAGRAANDLQHLRGRGLLLQRLGELSRARLHLVKQPHVLDRDHRLVGEGGEQLDLLISERLNVEPRRHQDADELPVAQQRHAQHSAVLFQAARLQEGQFGIGVGVRDMDGFASKHHTADDRRPIRCDWMTPHMCDVLRRKAVAGDVMVEPIPGKPDGHPVGATKMPGRTRPAYPAPSADRRSCD